MKKIPLSPEWMSLIGFAIIKLTFHFLTNTNYGLHRDDDGNFAPDRSLQLAGLAI